jgi:hypothetical protein
MKENCIKQNVRARQLTIDVDPGSAMTSNFITQLMADLETTKTCGRPLWTMTTDTQDPNSRPRWTAVSSLNAFDPSKTPGFFPGFFLSRYKKEHLHTGIALMTPD